jgi:hypothetical protein
MGKENPWLDTVPAWVPLADLLPTIEKHLGIPRDQATKPLRKALEELDINTALDDNGDTRTAQRANLGPWFYHSQEGSPGAFAVSHQGWTRVDWLAGTLAGYVIRVCWKQVEQILAPMAAKDDEEVGVLKIGPVRSAAGRPPKHDWDAFWIEVAIFASGNDLIEDAAQRELRSHMVQWSAEHMGFPAPDPTTVRKKLQKLDTKLERTRVNSAPK